MDRPFSILRGNYRFLAQSQLEYARFSSKSGHEADETGKALRTASRPSDVRELECSAPALRLQSPMNKLPQQCHFQWGGVQTSSIKSVGNLAIYEECLAIRRRLAKVDPHNTQWQHDQASLLDQIGDEYRNARLTRQAIGAYEASLAVLRHLAEIDPRDTQRQLDVASSLDKLGDVKLDGFDSWDAIACYEAAVAVWRRLRGREPNHACWHSNIAQSLEKIGDIKFAAGDSRGALTAYEEMLEADRALIQLNGTNLEWQLNLSSSLERIGDARLALNHAISAIEAYQESVAIRCRLIELDDSNTKWPEEVLCILNKIEHAKRAHEEHLTDQHIIDIAAPVTLRDDSREEVIARAKHLLLSFFALIKATRTQWLGRTRATAVIRSFQGVHRDRVNGIKPNDSVRDMADAKASNQTRMKNRHRRGRRGKRKGQHHNMQLSPSP
jgi:tetratricopeptide (TPR) repeat protein